MNIIFLDTETTGNTETARLIQLAFRKDKMGNFIRHYKPPVPIEYEAMAVHHITTEFINQFPTLEESGDKKKIQEVLDQNILIAHNAKFDIGILEKEGLKVGKRICTLKVSQRLFDFPSYKLQYLRYRLDLKISEGNKAHDAEGDIEVLEALFNHILKWESLEIPEQEFLEKMMKWTEEPVLLRRIQFGKHVGKEFKDIPRDYLSWLVGQPDLDEDLKYTLNYYLN